MKAQIKRTHPYAGGVKVRVVIAVDDVPGVYEVETLTPHPSGRKFPEVGERFRIGKQDIDDTVVA